MLAGENVIKGVDVMVMESLLKGEESDVRVVIDGVGVEIIEY